LQQPVSANQQQHAWKRLNDKMLLTGTYATGTQQIHHTKTAMLKTAMSGTAIPGQQRVRPKDMFRIIPVKWTRVAAALFLAFFLGSLASGWYMTLSSDNASDNEFFLVETPRGAKSTLTLTDGSSIILNAGSRLKYAKTYNIENRDIYLEGEGYFIVAKNEKLTFQVHTNGLVVSALGTEFNVKAYPDDDRVETTLVKGSVRITRDTDNEIAPGIVLKPNQRASFYIDSYEVGEVVAEPAVKVPNPVAVAAKPIMVKTESNINPETATSWKETRWVFERESLSALTKKLERQYDIHITIKDDELLNYHLSGTLEEESIEQVLKALQIALPIQYQINHKEVVLGISHSRKDNYKHLLTRQQ
jgi:transmembrane sensor